MASRRAYSATGISPLLKLEIHLYRGISVRTWTATIVLTSPASVATEGEQFRCVNIWSAPDAIGLWKHVAKVFQSITSATKGNEQRAPVIQKGTTYESEEWFTRQEKREKGLLSIGRSSVCISSIVLSCTATNAH